MKTKCEYSGTLFIISRKYSFGFSKSALTPRYTSEGRLPLCNTSSEAGALPSEVRIENYSDRKFSNSIFFSKFFWKPLLSTFYGTLFIISRKYFSVFRSPHLPLDTPFWTRCFPLVMQSRKAGFPFATRARKREPCLQRYVSRMTRTENFRSQFFFKVFLETTFLHVLWYPVHY